MAGLDKRVSWDKGYAALAHEYMASLPEINPALILDSADAQPRGVQQNPNGTITADIPNVGRVEWRAAIKASFIGPRSAKRQ